MFAKSLTNKVEEDCRKSEFVTSVLPDLMKLGNTVIRIDNLLSNTTVDRLNLMMGTSTITSERVVGVVMPRGNRNPDLMNVRIVMQSNNQELEQILSKNKCKTAHETTLVIQRTDFRELEKFLANNYDRICKLKTNNIMSQAQIIKYGQIPDENSNRAIQLGKNFHIHDIQKLNQ